MAVAPAGEQQPDWKSVARRWLGSRGVGSADEPPKKKRNVFRKATFKWLAVVDSVLPRLAGRSLL